MKESPIQAEIMQCIKMVDTTEFVDALMEAIVIVKVKPDINV
jgi:hypothetical protein